MAVAIHEARDLFKITRSRIFMNHAGVSPWSEPVRSAVVEVAERMASGGLDYDAYVADVARARDALARLVGGRAEEIALTRSTSHGISILAFGLDWREGDNVVGARWEYPANLYPWMALAARRGVELRLVQPTGGRIPPEAVFDLCDMRTRVVALSWVQFWNGFRADAASIGAECRRRGIVFALDGIQGLGALRLDAARLDCDFVAAGSGKWLLASPGVGFAWFAPRLIERVQPLSVGTSSVKENTQYFEPHLDWTDTARRFEEAGTSWQNIAALRAAVELINEVGIDDIEERVLTLSSRLGEGLAELGYEVIEPWPRRRSEASGIVSFRGGRSHQELLEVMKAAGVVCRTHRDFVRLSPHFYNTEEEVDAVLSALGPVTSR
jgi:selenocysteine lyase/cysteine desulfurase